MMTTETATRTLPATGRRVPAEPAYELTAMSSMRTSDGQAFTATVKIGRTYVGMIENHGTGGGTWFSPAGADARAQWAEFERGYTALNPEPEQTSDTFIYVPEPADALYDEADAAKRYARSVKGGTVIIREHIDGDAALLAWQDDAYPTMRFAIKGCKDHARALAAAVRHPSCADGKYDTYLPGTGWVHLTADVL